MLLFRHLYLFFAPYYTVEDYCIVWCLLREYIDSRNEYCKWSNLPVVAYTRRQKKKRIGSKQGKRRPSLICASRPIYARLVTFHARFVFFRFDFFGGSLVSKGHRSSGASSPRTSRRDIPYFCLVRTVYYVFIL